MTKPMTPQELAAIKARCEAATEGPWDLFGKYVVGKNSECLVMRCITNTSGTRDLLFIAHARTDLPACLAEIERLRGVVKAAFYEGGIMGYNEAMGTDWESVDLREYGDDFHFGMDEKKEESWTCSDARKALETK